MSIEYARLTIPQRWQWHAQVYAFRRVVLDVASDVHTSPPDPSGIWYDEIAVGKAEARLRQRLAEQAARCAASTAAHNAIRFADADAWRKRRYGTPRDEAAE